MFKDMYEKSAEPIVSARDVASKKFTSTSSASSFVLGRQGMGIMALEPRVLLDAAGIVTAVDGLADSLGEQQAGNYVETLFAGAPAIDDGLQAQQDALLASLDALEDAQKDQEPLIAQIPPLTDTTFSLAVLLDKGPDNSVETIGATPDTALFSRASEGEIVNQALDRITNNAVAPNRTFVVVDGSVEGYQTLIEGLDPAYDVLVIEPSQDGLSTLADALEGRSDIDALHILSHGDFGVFSLGTSEVSTESLMSTQADIFAAIGSALSQDADILIYGCDFGADASAVNALALATGADIAASDDLTGAAHLGGDWDLEVNFGLVDAESFELATYEYVLAPLNISVSANPIVDATGSAIFFDEILPTQSVTWQNAGTIGGVSIDLVATVISTDPGVYVTFLNSGDDPALGIFTGADIGLGPFGYSAGSTTIEWSIVDSVTGAPAFGEPQFTVSDIDGDDIINNLPGFGLPNSIETIAPNMTGLLSYEVDAATDLVVTTIDGQLIASGTDDDGDVLPSGDSLRATSAITFQWENTSSWQITYTAERSADGRLFSHDGDGDFSFSPPSITVLLPQLDLDASDDTATGTQSLTAHVIDGTPTQITDVDTTITNVTGNLESAVITLTNAQAGDTLSISGVSGSSGIVPGTSIAFTISGSTINFSGAANAADYQTALEAAQFAALSGSTNVTDRTFDVSVSIFDGNGGSLSSNFAEATVQVMAPPVTLPLIDLNSTAADSDTDTGFSSQFIVGSAAASIVDIDGDALDGSASANFTLLTITPSSALPDGASEILQIAGVDIPLNEDSVQSGVTIPGTSTAVDIIFRDGVITVREQSSGVISNADMDALIRSVTYRNEAISASDANDRTFAFQVAQFDPATFVIDFEELTPGTQATAAQIGSDPWWALASAQNGQIQDSDNAGMYNQTLADNADGTFLFHQTQGNVPNGERIVFGANDIPVESNQSYTLSIDVGRQNSVSAGPFEVLINGASIGIINVNSGTIQDWQTLTFNFATGSETEVDLQLRNTSTNGTGNDFGIDNIIFERDPLILSNIATATVEVIAALPPVAQDDAFTIDENPEGAEIGVITNGNLLADNTNGVDSDGNGDTLSITQINGVDITNGQQITLASGALLTIRTDGTFDYDPNGAFDSLDTGETETETFAYTLSDGTVAETDSATVTITINGDNDAPTIDLNGPDNSGENYADIFVEDEEGQPLANLLSIDAVVEDDEDNIAQVTIVPTLPTENDSDDEFLRINADGIDLTIRLSDGNITANTPLVFGETTFNVVYTAGEIIITNAAGGTFESDDLQGFLRLLAYQNVNQNNSDGERAFEFQVTDPAGITIATSTITVSRSNDAPIPTISTTSNGTVTEVGSETAAAPILIITPENAALTDALTEVAVLERLANGETTADLGLISVNDLLAQLDISDVEQTEFGIGIISADESHGVWQYLRTDIEGHEWTDFQLGDPDNMDATPVPEGQALLMDADAILRFVPNADFPGGAELEFRVWDQTVGTASNPPSTVADDSGGAAPTNTSSLSTTAFTLGLAADTDGDGILNANDVDDDNDGVLDRVEGFSTEIVNFNTDLAGTTSNGVTITGAFFENANAVADTTFIDNSNFTFLTSGTTELTATQMHVTNTELPLGASEDFNFTFGGSESVVEIYLHLNSIDQIRLEMLASENPNIGYQILSGVVYDNTGNTGDLAFGDPTNTARSDFDTTGVQDRQDGIGGGSADGTIRFYSLDGSPVTNLNLNVVHDFGGAAGNDGWQFAMEIATLRDTDSDGIADHLDIDSDDDGITDNIEAQTTDGYIVPSGTGASITDINQDGLDDQYDTRSAVNGGAGLIATDSAATITEAIIDPVDTDSLGGADYIDPDSDDDGINDADENGLGVTYSAADTDGDGLADVYEIALDGNANDGFIVNEGILPLDGTLPDTDNDTGGTITPLVNDLDYRDAPADPIAQNNAEATNEDSVVSGNAITDTDATDGTDDAVDGDTLSVTQVNGTAITSGAEITLPSGALLTMNADGSYDYDPNGQFENLQLGASTADSFTYTIDDGFGGTDTASVTITINGVNDPVTPTLPGNPNPPVDPSNYIPTQTGVDGSLVSNLDLTPYFTDADVNDTITLTIDPVDLPDGLTFDASTGLISGTPTTDASQGGVGGVYTIPVTASDGNGSTITTNVTYTITNPAPDAVNDTLSSTEDAAAMGNVITANDSDPDGDTLVVSEVGGDTANIGTAIAGANGGLFTIDANGDLSFDPNGEFEGLDVGETATTTVTYQISDGEGGTDTATVTVFVQGANDAPIVTGTLTSQTGTDSAAQLPFDDSTVFSDVDGEILDFTSPDLPSWMSINPVTGIITGTPPADASQGGPNSDGIYTVTITATDPDGEMVSTTVSYSFTNPAPDAVDDTLSSTEDAAVTGNVITANDSDPDGDILVVSEVDGDAANVGTAVAGTNGGLFTINPDGTYTFDPNGDFEALDVSETATTTITYLIDDGEGGTDMATVTVTVNGVNDAPSPQVPVGPNPPADDQDYIPAQMGNDSETLTPFSVAPYFTDVDGEVNFFSAPNLPSWMSIDAFTGVLTGTPPLDASQGGPNSDGTYPVTIVATDPDGETFSTVVDYVIVNPAPEAMDNAETTDEDTVLSASVFTDNGSGIDFDIDGDAINVTEVNGTPITTGSVITLPSGALLTMNSDGSYDYDPSGQFEALAVGESGADSFTYTISDGEGGTSQASVTITVEGINDAPIPVDPTQPTGPSNPGDPVDPDNPRDPPVDPLSYIPAQSGEDGVSQTPFDLSPYFGDPDGSDEVTLSIDPNDLPAGLTFDPVTNEITGTPSSDASQNGNPGTLGVYTIAVTATDPSGESFTTYVNYTITNPPPAAQDDVLSGDEDTVVTLSLFDDNGNMADIDPDGDDITVTRVETGNDESALTALTNGAGVDSPVAGSQGGLFTVNPDGTASFDPNGEFEDLGAGESRVTEIVYQIDDGQGGTDTAVLTYTVDGVNDAPIPVDPLQPAGPSDPTDPSDPNDPRDPPVDPQSYIPAQSGNDSEPMVDLDLTPYFGDPDGSDEVSLSIDPSDLPAGLTFDGTTISGTSSADASQGGVNGVYEIPVTATDPSGAEFTTIVTYTVTNLVPIVDTPIGPQAMVDDAVVSIPSGFSDPDGDTLSYSVSGLPSGLTIDPSTGEITGTVDNSASQFGPNNDGVYTVSVTADDGQGGTVTDTFELTVTNPAPDAVDDNDIGNEDAFVTGNVITPNDTDPDGDDMSVSEVGGDSANVGLPIMGTNGGLFTLNTDGSYIFDPSGDFEELDVGETEVTSITYQISDGEGGFDTATLEITVGGENDAPEVVDPNNPSGPADPNMVIPAQTGDDSAALTSLDSTVYFADVDVEPLTYSLSDGPAWLTIDPVTGLVTGTPSADASQGGLNSDGVYTVTITATDPDGAEVSTDVTYTITNPAPVAENDSFTTPEDTPISVNIIHQNDVDPDGDVMSIDAAALPDGTIIDIGVPTQLEQGVLTVNSDGSTSFEPALNFAGQLVFGYTVTDSQGGTDVATVTFEVTPVNDTPIPVDPEQLEVPTDPRDPNAPNYPTDPEDPRAGPLDPENYIPEQIGNDGEQMPELDLTPYFGDPDPNEPLAITLDENDLPPGLNFDPNTGIISGTLEADASQGGDEGSYVIPVTVTDPSGESFTTNVTYTSTNPPPVADDDGVLEVAEDTPTVLSLLGNDIDPDGDELTLTQINGTPVMVGVPTTLPSGATLTLNADNTVTYEPTEDYNGSDSFTYTIDDGEGGTHSAEVTLAVIAVNDAPELIVPTPGEAALLPRENLDGDDVSIDVSGPFSDIDGDPLTFTASGLPDGLSLDPLTGLVTGTLPPGTSANGPFTVTVTATDPDGQSASTDFVWTVTNIPPALVEPLPNITVDDADRVSIPTANSFTDLDNDALTYAVTGLPDNLVIDPETGLISGPLDNSQSQQGPFEITVTASDAQGESIFTSFTLSVDNPSPQIDDVEGETVVIGEDLQIDVGAKTYDPDGDEQLVYVSDDLPPGLSLDPEIGVITGTPTVPQDEPYIFSVTVNDGEGGQSVTLITLQVNEDVHITPDRLPADLALHKPQDPQGRGYGRADMYERVFEHEASSSWRDALGLEDRDFWGDTTAVPVSEYGDNAFIGVEVVVHEPSVYVSLQETISIESEHQVVSWGVDYGRSGGTLPAWMTHADGDNMVYLNRTAGDETAVLHIRALLDNGRTVSIAVEVDMATGNVDQVGGYGHRAATLSEQMLIEAGKQAAGSHALLTALAG